LHAPPQGGRAMRGQEKGSRQGKEGKRKGTSCPDRVGRKASKKKKKKGKKGKSASPSLTQEEVKQSAFYPADRAKGKGGGPGTLRRGERKIGENVSKPLFLIKKGEERGRGEDWEGILVSTIGGGKRKRKRRGRGRKGKKEVVSPSIHPGRKKGEKKRRSVVLLPRNGGESR